MVVIAAQCPICYLCLSLQNIFYLFFFNSPNCFRTGAQVRNYQPLPEITQCCLFVVAVGQYQSQCMTTGDTVKQGEVPGTQVGVDRDGGNIFQRNLFGLDWGFHPARLAGDGVHVVGDIAGGEGYFRILPGQPQNDVAGGGRNGFCAAVEFVVIQVPVGEPHGDFFQVSGVYTVGGADKAVEGGGGDGREQGGELLLQAFGDAELSELLFVVVQGTWESVVAVAAGSGVIYFVDWTAGAGLEVWGAAVEGIFELRRPRP